MQDDYFYINKDLMWSLNPHDRFVMYFFCFNCDENKKINCDLKSIKKETGYDSDRILNSIRSLENNLHINIISDKSDKFIIEIKSEIIKFKDEVEK